jgi:hypothetical protein
VKLEIAMALECGLTRNVVSIVSILLQILLAMLKLLEKQAIRNFVELKMSATTAHIKSITTISGFYFKLEVFL